MSSLQCRPRRRTPHLKKRKKEKKTHTTHTTKDIAIRRGRLFNPALSSQQTTSVGLPLSRNNDGQNRIRATSNVHRAQTWALHWNNIIQIDVVEYWLIHIVPEGGGWQQNTKKDFRTNVGCLPWIDAPSRLFSILTTHQPLKMNTI